MLTTNTTSDSSRTAAAAPAPVERVLKLPDSPILLWELNMPVELVRALTGETVAVRVLPEEPRCSRRLAERDGYPCVRGNDGAIWNDYRPVRVVYTDADGCEWRLPRYWLEREPEAPLIDPNGGETAFVEELNLPNYWDLGDVNITSGSVLRAGGRVTAVLVCRSARHSVRVYVRDEDDTVWRIPANWRRRRVMLPDAATLLAQRVPERVAARWAHRIVSVNYHQGSRCCLAAQYRFRDGDGGRWPVRIADCTVVGFGNGPEYRA